MKNTSSFLKKDFILFFQKLQQKNIEKHLFLCAIDAAGAQIKKSCHIQKNDCVFMKNLLHYARYEYKNEKGTLKWKKIKH